MRYPIINAKKTGTNIYKFCRKKNITANGLRVYMNFACNQTIYRWFHGQSLPSLDNFYALSILLGVNVEDLLVNENGIITVPGKDGCLFMHRERVKTDAIKDLFTGSLFPCEAVSPKDKGYWDLLREYNQGSEKFISGLSPEERRGFEHMQNCRQEAVQYEIEEAFIQGYSLGVRLTAEAFLLKQDHE